MNSTITRKSPISGLALIVGAALIIITLIALTACGPAQADAAPLALDGTSWTLTEIDSQPIIDGSQLTLEFRDGQVGGSAGVNNYFASFELAEDGALTIGPAGSTMMAGPQDLMDQEAAFLAALGSASQAEISGGSLLIHTADGVLTFAPAS